jgi:hypothetical protein
METGVITDTSTSLEEVSKRFFESGRASSSGVPGIDTRSFTDALSNEKVSSNKPRISGPLSGFRVSSFADASWNASGPTNCDEQQQN